MGDQVGGYQVVMVVVGDVDVVVIDYVYVYGFVYCGFGIGFQLFQVGVVGVFWVIYDWE